jgi:hypothetical protein
MAFRRPDGQDASAQGQQVDGQETLCHLFAQSHKDDHAKKGDYALFQSEEISEFALPGHN